MRAVKRPSATANDALDSCLKRVSRGNAGLRSRLEQTLHEILDAASDYEEKAGSGNLHLIPEKRNFVYVTEQELVANYDTRLARPSASSDDARPIYDEIKSLPECNRCPYCGHLPIESVDHFLPKRGYALLAVNPDNLVAACSSCNKAKGQYKPSTEDDCFIHPYFDAPDHVRWLGAEIAADHPPVVSYFVKHLDCWSEQFQARMEAHFSVLRLADLYAKEAACELNEIGALLMERYEEDGAYGVKRLLEENARSRRAARTNSWQSAMYAALAESEWFRTVGFRYIPTAHRGR